MTIPKTRSPSQTTIGAIHISSVMHVALKKPPPKKKKSQKKPVGTSQKKRKVQGKKRTADEFIAEEPIIEYVDIEKNNPEDSSAPASKARLRCTSLSL